MKKLLIGLFALSMVVFAQDKVVEGVVYTETVVNGDIKWIKKMVPKTTYVTVKKVIMVPAPVTSSMTIVEGTVNAVGQIVTSNRSQIRRVIRRVDRRDN